MRPINLLVAGAIVTALAISSEATARVRPVFKVASANMLPTLDVGDKVAVTGVTGNCSAEEPKVGDVVLYGRLNDGDYRGHISRIVAGPGDTVSIHRGILYIDGRQVLRQPTGYYDDGLETTGTIVRETLPGGASYDTLEDRGAEYEDEGDRYAEGDPRGEMAPLTLRSGFWFVLGDYRANSVDSRTAGPVPNFLICGIALRTLSSDYRERIGSKP